MQKQPDGPAIAEYPAILLHCCTLLLALLLTQHMSQQLPKGL
jgi:hypothetical protein